MDCQIVVLENGRVVEQGPHDVLLSKSGRYSQLWATQNSSIDAIDAAIKLESWVSFGWLLGRDKWSTYFCDFCDFQQVNPNLCKDHLRCKFCGSQDVYPILIVGSFRVSIYHLSNFSSTSSLDIILERTSTHCCNLIFKYKIGMYTLSRSFARVL